MILVIGLVIIFLLVIYDVLMNLETLSLSLISKKFSGASPCGFCLGYVPNFCISINLMQVSVSPCCI